MRRMLKEMFSETESRPLIPPKKHRNVLLAAFSALIYIVVFGMVTSYSAPAAVDMSKPGSRFVGITPQQVAWIASLPALSGVIGNAVSGYLSQKFGRRTVLMYVSVSYTLSWLVIAYAPNLGFVYTGRLVSGFCAGICAVAVPAYVVEISTVDNRGLLAAGFQVAFAVGVLFMMALGIVLRWSWLAVSAATFIVCGASILVFMPESPPWLIRKKRNGEAFNGLRFLRGRYSDASTEFLKIVENMASEPKNGLTVNELFLPQLYKPMVIAVALMFFQQFAGINALMSYAVELFRNSKSFIDPSVAATVVALVQVLTTGLSSLLMDKVGRRTLYITSGLCMTVSLLASGVYSHYLPKYDVGGLSDWIWVPLASFIIYIAAFSFGSGPVPFVVIPELVPTHSRSFVLAVSSVSSSLFSFVATKTFEDLRGVIGLWGVYWTYAVFAFAGSLFYWTFVPETKGRTIQEINSSFSYREERRPATI